GFCANPCPSESETTPVTFLVSSRGQKMYQQPAQPPAPQAASLLRPPRISSTSSRSNSPAKLRLRQTPPLQLHPGHQLRTDHGFQFYQTRENLQLQQKSREAQIDTWLEQNLRELEKNLKEQIKQLWELAEKRKENQEKEVEEQLRKQFDELDTICEEKKQELQKDFEEKSAKATSTSSATINYGRSTSQNLNFGARSITDQILELLHKILTASNLKTITGAAVDDIVDGLFTVFQKEVQKMIKAGNNEAGGRAASAIFSTTKTLRVQAFRKCMVKFFTDIVTKARSASRASSAQTASTAAAAPAVSSSPASSRNINHVPAMAVSQQVEDHDERTLFFTFERHLQLLQNVLDPVTGLLRNHALSTEEILESMKQKSGRHLSVGTSAAVGGDAAAPGSSYYSTPQTAAISGVRPRGAAPEDNLFSTVDQFRFLWLQLLKGVYLDLNDQRLRELTPVASANVMNYAEPAAPAAPGTTRTGGEQTTSAAGVESSSSFLPKDVEPAVDHDAAAGEKLSANKARVSSVKLEEPLLEILASSSTPSGAQHQVLEGSSSTTNGTVEGSAAVVKKQDTSGATSGSTSFSPQKTQTLEIVNAQDSIDV
ncbi:unnamed protein product, partial [Amoebophrya sp. A120]